MYMPIEKCMHKSIACPYHQHKNKLLTKEPMSLFVVKQGHGPVSILMLIYYENIICGKCQCVHNSNYKLVYNKYESVFYFMKKFTSVVYLLLLLLLKCFLVVMIIIYEMSVRDICCIKSTCDVTLK